MVKSRWLLLGRGRKGQKRAERGRKGQKRAERGRKGKTPLWSPLLRFWPLYSAFGPFTPLLAPLSAKHNLHTPAHLAQPAPPARPCACVQLCIRAFATPKIYQSLSISISINLTIGVKIFIKILDKGILMLYICSGI